MSSDILASASKSLRGLDSNSLLRLYDGANVLFTSSSFVQERAAAGRAIERITRELQRRGIQIKPAPQGGRRNP